MNALIEFFEKYFSSDKAASWDNTGHLIQIPVEKIKIIILTNDLTENVVNESIEKEVDVIITYHPIMFNPIKKISPFLSKIIRNGLNVYSFHTTADSFMTHEFLKQLLQGEELENAPNIVKSAYTSYFTNKKHTNEHFIKQIKEICRISQIRMVLGKNQTILSCPEQVHFGCGSAKFPVVKDSLIITGEMTHHPILTERSRNNTVILLEHCNSERWFLKTLKKLLNEEIGDIEVIISENDTSPIQII